MSAPGCTESPTDVMRRRFQVRSPLMVKLLSEFFSTTLLLFVGTGICMQFVLSEGKVNAWIQVNLGWGLLVALCAYGTFYSSGGHMNPAVSLAMVTLGKLPFRHFLLYSVAQTAGAFVGAGLSFHVYKDELHNYTGGGLLSITGPKATAGALCSFPKEHISHYAAFIDQVAGTALLVLFIASIIDKRNKIPTHLQPLLFGLGLVVVGTAYGIQVGYPINPARDFGPRLFALCAGYGWEVISYRDYYFWIPVIAPLIGGPLGAWLYGLFVSIHIPDPISVNASDTIEATTLNNNKQLGELEPLNDGVA